MEREQTESSYRKVCDCIIYIPDSEAVRSDCILISCHSSVMLIAFWWQWGAGVCTFGDLKWLFTKERWACIVSYFFSGRTEAMLLMQSTEKQTLCTSCAAQHRQSNFKEGLKGSHSSESEKCLSMCLHPSSQHTEIQLLTCFRLNILLSLILWKGQAFASKQPAGGTLCALISG